MEYCWLLYKMKIRQGYNLMFLTSKKGWFLILSEVVALVMVIVMSRYYPLVPYGSGLYLLCGFIMLWANGYSLAEKKLYSLENKADLLLTLAPKDILWANIGQILGGNLRVTTLFPFLIPIFQGQWLYLPLVLLMPFMATLLAAASNMVIKLMAGRRSSFFYMLSVLIYVAGVAGSLWLILGKVSESTALTWPFIWLGTAVAGSIFGLFLVPHGLGELWRTTYLQRDIASPKSHSLKGYGLANRIFRNGLAAKDWVLWWRHPVMYFRFLIFLLCLILVIALPFFRSIPDRPFFNLAPVLIWIISFGELAALPWQNEGDRKTWLWLANKSPGFIIGSKLLPLVPLILLGGVSALCIGFSRSLAFPQVLLGGFITTVFLCTLCLFSFILAFSSWRNGGEPENPLFNQAPVMVGSLLAHVFQLPLALILLLPPPSSLALMTAIGLVSILTLQILFKRCSICHTRKI